MRLASRLNTSRLPLVPVSPDAAETPTFRSVEMHLFDACTHRCGYCWFAESGQVLDFKQLEPFRSTEWIDSVAQFFNSRTTASAKWLFQLTGGEPLIAPNLDRLCESFFECGNRVAFYTALLVGRKHPGFRFLESARPPAIDYVMASFHPEAELDEARYFDKLAALKDAGHRVLLRFVGHPARLGRLAELADKCQRLDVCFFPTTLLSSAYPRAYREEDKVALTSHFSSLTQFIMLEGGIDTRGSRCYAGSKIVAVNLQTGDITPCISVHRPIIGNVFRNEMRLYSDSIACPEAGINCVCDVHFQQNIVNGCHDNINFEAQKAGFVAPRPQLMTKIDDLRRTAGFYANPSQGIGRVQDESRLFYTIEEVRRNYRANHGIPEPTVQTPSVGTKLVKLAPDSTEFPLFSLEAQTIFNDSQVSGFGPVTVSTPPQRWSFALGFPTNEKTRQMISPLSEIRVRLELDVENGIIGIGVVNRELSAYIAPEMRYSPSNDIVCEIALRNLPPDSILVLRNTAISGVVSKAIVRSIAAFVVAD